MRLMRLTMSHHNGTTIDPDELLDALLKANVNVKLITITSSAIEIRILIRFV
jgi:hypothetical protein